MLSVTTDKVRYLNKNNNANERENYSKWWKEQIEHYGTLVDYFSHGYSLTSHNFVYGEDPTSVFVQTPQVVMLTDITNDALMLSKFGIAADCDMTAVIHISSYYEQFGCGKEPKAGDLIRLTEYGADRPGGRSAPIYEITERDDEYLQMTNALIGHYVWHIKCKRYEYSYEPGIDIGPNNKQVSDGGDYGRISEGENPEELFQPYPDSAQNSAKCIYDYYDKDNAFLDRNLPGQYPNTFANHYAAPADPSCPPGLTVTTLSAVLGPYSEITSMTTEEFQTLMQTAVQAASAAPNVLVDINPESSTDIGDVSTISKPEDQIILPNDFDLNSYDGGTI
jgi:hypothetical protein